MIRRAALTAVYILAFAIGGAFLAPSLEFWAGVVVSASCGGPIDDRRHRVRRAHTHTGVTTMIDWQSFWGNVVGCFEAAPWPVQASWSWRLCSLPWPS